MSYRKLSRLDHNRPSWFIHIKSTDTAFFCIFISRIGGDWTAIRSFWSQRWTISIMGQLLRIRKVRAMHHHILHLHILWYAKTCMAQKKLNWQNVFFRATDKWVLSRKDDIFAGRTRIVGLWLVAGASWLIPSIKACTGCSFDVDSCARVRCTKSSPGLVTTLLLLLLFCSSLKKSLRVKIRAGNDGTNVHSC